MKWFYNIFQFTVLGVLIFNPLVVFLIWDNFLNFWWTATFITLLFFLLIEFLTIIYIVKKFFHDPIIKLEHTIKSFYVWNLKNTTLDFHKTMNPHLNYALDFFARTLHTLKNIKEEFIHGKEIKWEVELWKEIQWTMLTKTMIQNSRLWPDNLP